MAHNPATVALCSTLPRHPMARPPVVPAAGQALPATQSVPVTWIVDLETLLGAEATAVAESAAVALAIDPAWLASRQLLRDAIGRARAARPALEAAVLRGAALKHHDVVAEAGIRIVLTDAFDESRRGSRRPAPHGWPCRNAAWGLWEVRLPPSQGATTWAWLAGIGSGPTARRGSLRVLCAADDAPRLAGWRDWTARRVARGDVVAVTLPGLRAVLEGGRRPALAGSVLRAA